MAEHSSPLQSIATATASPAAMMMASRGRPKGWRPGMSYAEMRGNPLPRSHTGSGSGSGYATPRRTRPRVPVPGAGVPGAFRRRGRPPKVASPPPREVYRRTEAPFVAFLCEWAECRAELHNLETLRRHVRVVHSSDGGGICRWGRCEGAARDAPEVYFADGGELGRHVEEAHLVPFAWHVGDGPSNVAGGGRRRCEKRESDKREDDGGENEGGGDGDGGGGDGVPDYLKDAEGRQVTPWVKEQELEDWATWRDNRRRLKELLIRMDENLPSEESDGPDDDADG